LRTNGGEEHEAACGGTGERDCRLGVDCAVIVFRKPGRAVRETGRMDHRVIARERIRHVTWHREIAHYGAARLWRQYGRPTQQYTHSEAALRQLFEQMPADEGRWRR
jgi:hypothetical protein